MLISSLVASSVHRQIWASLQPCFRAKPIRDKCAGSCCWFAMPKVKGNGYACRGNAYVLEIVVVAQ
ncbi:hypothetical protein Hdeb2414_s0006g00212901 [Helianthus debilis subsp. tardiflorus]